MCGDDDEEEGEWVSATFHLLISGTSYLLTCLVCLRRRTRSFTNDRSPGWYVLRCCHGITQGQLGVVDDLVSPAEWWASSRAAP